MIMSMYNNFYKKICVTNRHLIEKNGQQTEEESLLSQLERVLKSGCSGIILREKDMELKAYEQLAAKVLTLCHEYEVPCALHTYVQAAVQLHASILHLPLSQLLLTDAAALENQGIRLGASIHSVSDAVRAYQAGATYLTAGHIFATDCKKGLPPRGIDFLQNVCEAVPIPVYAIGGITAENEASCIAAGAAGICQMSEYMHL